MRAFIFTLATFIVLEGFEQAKASSEDESLSDQACISRLANGQNQLHAKINALALKKLFQGATSYKQSLKNRTGLLVDYSLNSKKKRAFLIDMKTCEVLAEEYVAHGGTLYTPAVVRWGDPKHDGMLKYCVKKDGSRQNMTRPGFYTTVGCHLTKKDFPTITAQCGGIKMWGLEKRNMDAYSAGVVIHEHDGMDNGPGIKAEGQVCPVFAPGRLKNILELQGDFLEGSLVYLYAPQCT